MKILLTSGNFSGPFEYSEPENSFVHRVLARVRRYLTTGQVGQPTRIPAQIVRDAQEHGVAVRAVETDALVLASAGLRRLGFASRISMALPSASAADLSELSATPPYL